MARLSRLFSRKDAGTPAPDQASAKQRKRVAEVTAAPASSPLPPAPQPDVSVTPPHHAADDGQQYNGALTEPEVAAAETNEPARRHHRADLRTPQQADPALKVRCCLGSLPKSYSGHQHLCNIVTSTCSPPCDRAYVPSCCSWCCRACCDRVLCMRAKQRRGLQRSDNTRSSMMHSCDYTFAAARCGQGVFGDCTSLPAVVACHQQQGPAEPVSRDEH